MNSTLNSTDTELGSPLEFTISITSMPERLDKVLALLLPDHSRSRIQQWIEQGFVVINGNVTQKIRYQVLPGDVLHVWPQKRPEEQAYEAEDIALDIVDQSPDWLIINKPAGLVTHPGAGNWSGTLLNGLLFHYPELKQVARAGIVHRLDKDTSGLMVVARNEIAQTHLVRQLQARSVLREYVAMCHGFLHGADVIDMPIGRDGRVPVRMSTQNAIAPRQARTHYEAVRHGLVDRGVAVSNVICRLETGRTHQIRVHLSSIGHPLVGDEIYGGQHIAGATRQMLHARQLGFLDPSTQRKISAQIDPPADFQLSQDLIQWKD